ncbi:facilitated trehalose transporter Tret1-like [Rhodnius prolixus]|uniref:facilitated trehalose transporter Tret1-like n=1 Tax=Rhodnius prolixus TaxID=13249 RepID=UPI003D187925
MVQKAMGSSKAVETDMKKSNQLLSPNTRALLCQYAASASATISVIMSGNSLGWPSPALPRLLGPDSPVPMDKDDSSWMISLMYLGNLFSPIPCGILMERIGRKMTLLYLNLFPFSSWLIILLTRSTYWLYLARFLAGLWLGIVYTVVPIYLGEIAEPRIRGSLSTLFAITTYVGILFEYVLGPYVSYDALALASGSFCIIFILAFGWMPETPYFLIKNGEKARARESLHWLRGAPNNVDEELYKIESAIQQQKLQKGKLKDLLATKGNRKALIIVGVLSVFQRFSGIGAMIAYTSVTLPKGSLGPIGRDECVIILGVVWVTSTFIASFLIDKLGRKSLLIVSSVGCAIATFLAGLWFLLNELTYIDVSGFDWSPFICFVLHGFFYSIGLNPIVTTVKGEVFSACIKGVASAITTLMLALASFILNKSYQMIADYIGMYMNYWLYALGCVLAVIFTVTYVVETKGRTLQEIQDELNGANCENEISKL